jgi:hypothetical protein
MHHEWWKNVRKGMDVCDMNGDKVGTVKDIYERSRAMGGTQQMTEGWVHVDSGFLGLGKDLYIPFNAFRDCDNNCCYLNTDKNQIDRMGWDQKPASL